MFAKAAKKPPATPPKPGALPAMAGGAESVAIVNAWYRERYTTVLRMAGGLVVVVMALCAIIAGLLLTRPEPRYFAVDARGQVVPLAPLNAPLISNDALTQWAADTARMAYSLDFVHWKNQMGGLRDRFSEAAYKEWVAEMERSGNLDLVRDQRVILESMVEPSTIVQSGVGGDGRYQWNVEVPLTVVTHYGSTSRRSQRLLVTLVIKRVDNRFRPESGVLVTKLLTRLA